MNLELILRPCPWCKKTPEISMLIPEYETWSWYIYCNNEGCLVKPIGPTVSFRNTSKKKLDLFTSKVTEMCWKWNLGNDYEPYEKKIINLDKMVFE